MKKFATLLFCAMILLSGCGDNSAQKNEEVKQDTQKVEASKPDTTQNAAEVKNNANQPAQSPDTSRFKDSREISLAGVLPGISLDEMIANFGEPVTRNGDDLTFGNGMMIDLDEDKNIVEKITIRTPDIATPEGIAVGMDENALNAAYGSADKVDHDDGEVEHEYFSKDRTRSITFKLQNGIITEIESELHD